jgi:hypothetical protein
LLKINFQRLFFDFSDLSEIDDSDADRDYFHSESDNSVIEFVADSTNTGKKTLLIFIFTLFNFIVFYNTEVYNYYLDQDTFFIHNFKSNILI